MAKKELDKLSQEMLQCEADGFGVHYGRWKAVQPIYVPPEKEMRVCLFCGKPFEPKTPKQKYCSKVCSYSVLEKRSNEAYQKKKAMRELGVNDGKRTRQAVS